MESEKLDTSPQQPRKGFGKPLIIFFLILLPLVGFFLGTQYKRDTNLPNTNQAKIDELNKQLAQKEEEIQLCVNDSAKEGNATKATYSFPNFGVYAPSFENKEVGEIPYLYKRQNIIQKNLILEQETGKDVGAAITVWEYAKYDSSTLNPATSEASYVIFGGYENYGIHPKIIEPNPQNKESYVNPKNLKMYWSYEYCPKTICKVNLEFFSRYTPSGHPIFVQIWGISPSYLSDNSGLNSPGIIQTKEKLKKIADTVEDFSTHH